MDIKKIREKTDFITFVRKIAPILVSDWKMGRHIEVISEKLKQLERNLIFMFSGQGMQYKNMAIGLYNSQPVFKNYIDKCCQIISDITKVKFKKYLYKVQIVAARSRRF